MDPTLEQRPSGGGLPERPIERLTGPLTRLLHLEAASGVVLLACTAAALGLANSALAESYQAFWNRTLTISLGSLALAYPLWYWVNDGLMTLFFFVIGLEIKRELIHGELRDPRTRALPVAAALGGAVMPIVVFLLLLGNAAGKNAWAVPWPRTSPSSWAAWRSSAHGSPMGSRSSCSRWPSSTTSWPSS